MTPCPKPRHAPRPSQGTPVHSEPIPEVAENSPTHSQPLQHGGDLLSPWLAGGVSDGGKQQAPDPLVLGRPASPCGHSVTPLGPLLHANVNSRINSHLLGATKSALAHSWEANILLFSPPSNGFQDMGLPGSAQISTAENPRL